MRVLELKDPATGHVLYCLRVLKGQDLSVQTGSIILNANVSAVSGMGGVDISDGLWHHVFISHSFDGRKEKMGKHMFSGKILLCVDGLPVLDGASFPFSVSPQSKSINVSGDCDKMQDDNSLQGFWETSRKITSR